MTKIVFMGTPDFAVASLKMLHRKGLYIAAVVTAPDKPAGRGRQLQSPAVKQYAQAEMPGIPVLQPVSLKDQAFIDQLRQAGAVLFVVVAFRMLPREVWSLPPLGTINLHASLLPQYRGAAPIQWAVINGESATGLTTFFIDENLDTGQILQRKTMEIHPDESAGELHNRMKDAGADLLFETVSRIFTKQITPIPQEDFADAYAGLKTAPKISKHHARIDWSRSANEVHNLVRGMNPVPGAWDELQLNDGNTIFVKIYRSLPKTEIDEMETGALRITTGGKLLAGTGKGAIELLELQAAGKNRMEAGAFIRGIRLEDARFTNTEPSE